MERQLALERVRSRIATDLHDDIGASLSRIAVMSEAVKNRVSPEDSDSKRMLAEMAESSRLLVGGMSDIVWSIDPRRDHLGDVVSRLRAFGSDVLEPRGIRWVCEGPSDPLDQTLSPDQRRELYLLFKEAIHNIARHSQARNVFLRITREDSRLSAHIEDDGRGVPFGAKSGLGFASMQGRAARLGGELRIDGRPEGGTRAALSFPL
jgi:signal transduction histidine kinase